MSNRLPYVDGDGNKTLFDISRHQERAYLQLRDTITPDIACSCDIEAALTLLGTDGKAKLCSDNPGWHEKLEVIPLAKVCELPNSIQLGSPD